MSNNTNGMRPNMATRANTEFGIDFFPVLARVIVRTTNAQMTPKTSRIEARCPLPPLPLVPTTKLISRQIHRQKAAWHTPAPLKAGRYRTWARMWPSGQGMRGLESHGESFLCAHAKAKANEAEGLDQLTTFTLAEIWFPRIDTGEEKGGGGLDQLTTSALAEVWFRGYTRMDTGEQGPLLKRWDVGFDNRRLRRGLLRPSFCSLVLCCFARLGGRRRLGMADRGYMMRLLPGCNPRACLKSAARRALISKRSSVPNPAITRKGDPEDKLQATTFPTKRGRCESRAEGGRSVAVGPFYPRPAGGDPKVDLLPTLPPARQARRL